MKCFVTGASGFIGANLVHELATRGHSVRAFLRPGCDLRGLHGAVFEKRDGDLSDRDKLLAGMRGCDWCFHVAASYHLWLRDYSSMYATNVDGTRNVLEMAAQAGCSRIVYTSTVGCLASPEPGGIADESAIETNAIKSPHLSSHYKRSKWQAEQVALALARAGMPIVIVNPSAPIGSRDLKPTPTGKFIVDFLNRKIPAFIDTGLNWVPVRDVVMGHLLAAEKGRIGERYILGHIDGNWTMKQALEVLSELSGLPAPRYQVPYWIAFAASLVSETLARMTGIPPKAPMAGVRMAKCKMFFSPAKAIRELGLPQTPPREAFRESIEWFRAQGYVRR